MRAKDKSSRVAQSYNNNCQKNLKKWAVRLINSNLERAFKTWKETKANLSSREKLLVSIKKQMLRNTYRKAWIRWKELIAISNIEMTSQEIMTAETGFGI